MSHAMSTGVTSLSNALAESSGYVKRSVVQMDFVFYLIFNNCFFGFIIKLREVFNEKH